MNLYERIYNILLEEKPKKAPTTIIGNSKSCAAGGGCKKVHPGIPHWKYIYGPRTPHIQFPGRGK